MKLDKNGSVHLVIGPMFAGKSTHLIKTVWGFRAIHIPVFVIKHVIDDRYEKEKVSSHNLVTHDCHTCDHLMPLLEHPQYTACRVVVLDEAQFFEDLVQFVQKASDVDKKNVIVYGLSGDFKRKPFKNISEVYSLANEVEKLKAYCFYCKDSTPADYTLRTLQSNEQVIIGTGDIYKPVCRKHYLEMNK